MRKLRDFTVNTIGKRSDFELVKRDFYPTIDPKAHEVIAPLIKGKSYAEPCYGAGDLVSGIHKVLGTNLCAYTSDIEPVDGLVETKDAMELTRGDLGECDLIVTNPPFTKKVLLPMLDHFITLKPTWLLLPADLMHNKYFKSYMDKCTQVHSIGRLCWFYKDGKRVASTDNFAWYFWPEHGATTEATEFIGRTD